MNLLIIGGLLIGLIWAALLVVGMQLQAMFSLSRSPSKLTLTMWFILFLLLGPLGVVLTLLTGLVFHL